MSDFLIDNTQVYAKKLDAESRIEHGIQILNALKKNWPALMRIRDAINSNPKEFGGFVGDDVYEVAANYLEQRAKVGKGS